MKILKIGLLIILIVMSLAAGAAKIMMVEQEMAFFRQAGLATAAVFPFGLVQVAGGLLAIATKTRHIGVTLMAITFLASAIMLFVAGSIPFAVVSLIPAVLSAFLARRQRSI